ncbi:MULTISPECIES: hypothetical protein [Kocuria]|uniref:hypothetical protein n=1 Tax=Kocuria TaxID=57493 RepID=UPI0006610A8B|nr:MULTISPECIES: hypothetical protein [Kocuria]MCT1368354.1 hypothetical protein [Rothia sp. p3-SID1597]RUQ23338.1 hypothetical protein D8M21_01105 [Kocuria sp. HSID16901]
MKTSPARSSRPNAPRRFPVGDRPSLGYLYRAPVHTAIPRYAPSSVGGSETCERLVEPSLVQRFEGVREDLEASRERGEITEDQLTKFLARLEVRLLAEQQAGASA